MSFNRSRFLLSFTVLAILILCSAIPSHQAPTPARTLTKSPFASQRLSDPPRPLLRERDGHEEYVHFSDDPSSDSSTSSDYAPSQSTSSATSFAQSLEQLSPSSSSVLVSRSRSPSRPSTPQSEVTSKGDHIMAQGHAAGTAPRSTFYEKSPSPTLLDSPSLSGGLSFRSGRTKGYRFLNKLDLLQPSTPDELRQSEYKRKRVSSDSSTNSKKMTSSPSWSEWVSDKSSSDSSFTNGRHDQRKPLGKFHGKRKGKSIKPTSARFVGKGTEQDTVEKNFTPVIHLSDSESADLGIQ